MGNHIFLSHPQFMEQTVFIACSRFTDSFFFPVRLISMPVQAFCCYPIHCMYSIQFFKITIFSDVITCSLVDCYWYFKGIWCLYLWGWDRISRFLLEACTEDGNPYSACHENLKYSIHFWLKSVFLFYLRIILVNPFLFICSFLILLNCYIFSH